MLRMASMEDVDQEIFAIARLKDGDLSGLDLLMDRYMLRAVRSAYLITLDRPLAEDVVQNVFVRLVNTIGQFDSQRPFAPWFLRSVIHDALKAAQKERRKAPLEAADAEAARALMERFSDLQPGPEETAIRAETRREVWQALEMLPPEQRTVIVQRYYLGYSEAEMSLALQRPAGTIKWLLHRARGRLRELLKLPDQAVWNRRKPAVNTSERYDEE